MRSEKAKQADNRRIRETRKSLTNSVIELARNKTVIAPTELTKIIQRIAETKRQKSFEEIYRIIDELRNPQLLGGSVVV